MPVYTNDIDTLQDFIVQRIKTDKITIDPYYLSEWIWGYISHDMLHKDHPEVVRLVEDAYKLFSNLECAEVMTTIIGIIDEVYKMNYQEWALKYLRDDLIYVSTFAIVFDNKGIINTRFRDIRHTNYIY